MNSFTLQRHWFSAKSTIGVMNIGGLRVYSLEDVARPRSVKVPKETCIEPGVYPVTLTWSPKFGRVMPLLLNVPLFSDIRIHYGNDAEDTEGCILVGTTKAPDWIGSSRIAFDLIFPRIQALQPDLQLVITNEPLDSHDQPVVG
jgi:hypothetical protein